jgi:hypothetical protein
MTDTMQPHFGKNQNEPAALANSTPIYAKCLACPDYGTSCRGLDLRYFGDVATIRAFHKALKKSHPNITLKAIAAAAPTISGDTINEYFSNVARNDYRWTTVVAIDNAMVTLCGNRVGMPPIDHSCPEASSESRNKLAAAQLQLAAADLNLATVQAECDELRRRLSDSDGSHLSQLAELQTASKSELEWLKNDVKLWRLLVFILLAMIVFLIFFK